MNWILAALLAMGFAGSATPHDDAGASLPELIVTHVTVIDATGAPAAPDRDLVIAGGKIVAVGSGAAKHRSGARVIDGQGLFVIPGLWDMHAHAFAEGSAHLLPLFYFDLALANGVTGLRDMAGFADNIEADEQWRTALRTGAVLGPELVMSGALVDGPNPTYPRSIVVRTPQQARDAVDSLKRRGVDFIKVYNMLPKEEFFAIAEEAKQDQIPFVGHVPLAVPAVEASNAGQKSFEHLWGVLLGCSSREGELRASMLAEANRSGTRPSQLRPHIKFAPELAGSYDPQKAATLFSLLVKNNTWQVPTLSVLHMLAYIEDVSKEDDPRFKYFPKVVRDEWRPTHDWRTNQRDEETIRNSHLLFEQDLKLVREMHTAGVRMLAGTDSTEPYTYPGFTLHDELAWLVAAGLTPMEALQSATRNAAEFLGRSDRQGTVEVGKDANMVLLRANPLTDIHNTQKIEAVILHGRYLSRADLDHFLETVAQVAAQN
jgi:imidazolonepropionase-like amidohydrolase